jgi:hypothetical protein
MTDSHSIRRRQQERRKAVHKAHADNTVWCSSEAEECFDDCTMLLSEMAALEAQCAAMVEALKEMKVGVHVAAVASCTCRTKTHVPQHHDESCRFRRLAEIALVAEQALSNLPARSVAIGKVKDALWQLLDDMGRDGVHVCLAAKAQARIAFEPFRNDDSPLDWPLAEAEKIMKEANR